MVRIGYLGPRGTFTKLAVDTAFNGENKQSFTTIPECIDAVQNEDIDIGVVPLENAIEGTVQITVDYLVHQVRLPVVAEIVVPIQQHLLVKPGFTGKLSGVPDVYSHSHAIAQCHQFLHMHMPDAKLNFTSSTGKAAEVVSGSEGNAAAVGNRLAASEYGLDIYRENIHD